MRKQIIRVLLSHMISFFIGWMFMSASVQSPGALSGFFVTCWTTGPCIQFNVYGLTSSCQASASPASMTQ